MTTKEGDKCNLFEDTVCAAVEDQTANKVGKGYQTGNSFELRLPYLTLLTSIPSGYPRLSRLIN